MAATNTPKTIAELKDDVSAAHFEWIMASMCPDQRSNAQKRVEELVSAIDALKRAQEAAE